MPQPTRDSGFTLIEVLVTITLMCALMAIAVIGFNHWTAARAQDGTATDLQTILRRTQQQAITEGHLMCVAFDDTSFTVWRDECSTGDKVDGPIEAEGDAQLSNPVFTPMPSGGTDQTATFSPRGRASAGTIEVVRPGSDHVITVRVEGFTGRVCRMPDCDVAAE